MAGNKLYIKQRRFWCVLGVNLFEGLRESDLEVLTHYSQNRSYRRGEIIYLPGDPATTVYFLKAGRVKLVYIDESGRRLTMTICRPGQPFGELTLSEEREHRLLAEALTDVELCSIPKSALMQFAAERPQISLRLTKWAGRQLQEVQVRLEELLFKDVPTRLARVLLRLAEEHGESTSEGVLIDLPLTHQELAELIGSTRETTSLTLSAFTREGLLTRRRRCFLLRDPEALRQRAE